LVNALLYHCRDLSGVNGVLRPGIVHRLDKDTSGLIAAAKHDRAHHGLAAQLAGRTMGRVYYAVVRGVMKPDTLTVNKNIGRHSADRKKMAVLPSGKGKTAITHIRVLERYNAFTLVEARLETGRTHQIRVHLAHAGHPVLYDPVYGPRDAKAAGQLLHAKSLHFRHPVTGEDMSFDSPLPSHISVFIEAQHHNRT
jgi:23S rRNA pseudouridine1911/1915/1917 synthase